MAAGTDPVSGRRRTVYETVHAADNRAGAKAADARLAELIAAIESGREPERHGAAHKGPLVADLASAWQETHRPRRARRSGAWLGWSPKTAKTVADNFRSHILPAIGSRPAERVTGLELGDLDWRAKRVTIVQHKTGRPLSLPLLDDVGWAIIDYVGGGPSRDRLPEAVRQASPPLRRVRGRLVDRLPAVTPRCPSGDRVPAGPGVRDAADATTH